MQYNRLNEIQWNLIILRFIITLIRLYNHMMDPSLSATDIEAI